MSQNIARIGNPIIQSLLPQRNTLLHPLTLPRSYRHEELVVIIAGILRDVSNLEVVDLSCEAVQVPSTSSMRHVPLVRPPIPFTGFLTGAKANTWTRAARRKAQASMVIDDPTQFDALPPLLLCRVYWSFTMGDESTLINEEEQEKEMTTATLGVDWVRGRDRAMFESFASHIAKKVRTAMV
jgi:hypothetical protein